jgi:tRNA (mo5U34)-methyltransferase
MTDHEIQARIAALGPWFYEFDLGIHGRTTSKLPPAVLPIHQTRLEMINRVVDEHFGARVRQIRCLDAGCHEGFYSIAMARKKLREVRGVDVRADSLAKARFVGDVLGLTNLSFELRDCEDLHLDDAGPYELCLLLGVLYHLESPMRCLRSISRITSDLCIIETQVIDEVTGQTEWGSRQWTYPYHGVLALIDESREFNNQNMETGASPVAMCPSSNALQFMLKQAGFSRTEFITPPPSGYEQHRRGKRVICAAYK